MVKLEPDEERLLRAVPLFQNIEELDALLACLHAQRRSYSRGQFIAAEGQPATHIGIMLHGQAQVLHHDYLGNRTIVTSLSQGDLFAETFACAQIPTLPVSVQATAPTVVLLAEYARIAAPCGNGCAFHSQLVTNMMHVLAAKNLMLNSKLAHLAKRSTRDKLLSYLFAQAQNAGNPSFTIPFNRQQLADYLCVDRSALSAELSRMQKDGLLQFHRNTFTLAKPAAPL